MEDENKLPEVDTRVRAAVNPPASVVERVVKRALTGNDGPPQNRGRRSVAVVLVASAVLLIALTIWQGRERTPAHPGPTSLAITGNGSLLVVSLAAQTASPADPLQSRVTIEYRESPAANVIGDLAAAAGLKVEMGSGTLRPVTITLTNVKLGTALNAVCENAWCVWRLQGTLSVTPVPNDKIAALPALVSFEVRDTPLGDFLRAFAAAIDVPVTVDPVLSSEPMNVSFKNTRTTDVLNFFCGWHNCQWDFDAVRGLRVTRKQ